MNILKVKKHGLLIKDKSEYQSPLGKTFEKETEKEVHGIRSLD